MRHDPTQASDDVRRSSVFGRSAVQALELKREVEKGLVT